MSAPTRRTCGFALLIVFVTAASARGAWTGATIGTTNNLGHSYSTNANWGGGAPELTFSPALTGATALYFSADWTTTGAWNIAYTGSYPLTLEGGGTFDAAGNTVAAADHTVTLGTGGNLNLGVAGSSNQTITLGSTTPGLGLNINLGSSTKTIATALGTGALPDAQISGVISGNGFGAFLNVAGVSGSAGRLLLSNGNNSYSINTHVLAGTLLLGANATSGAGNTVLGSNAAAVSVGNTLVTGLDAALLTYGPYSVSRGIAVQSGDTGTITLGGAQTSGTSYFTGNITLQKTVTLQALGGSEVDFSGNLLGGAAAGVTVAGGGTVKIGGANTYSGGTTVKTGTTAKITGSIAQTNGVAVQTGANLELAGAAGSPLASTIPVTNDGALLVSQPALAGAIGGLGTTTVNSSLSAASIMQNTLTIGAGGTVTIRETTGGSVSTVPEPGTWVLIGTALMGWLAFRRRCR
jgi:fibronectin-binding autotransporter adhesin